MDLIEKLKKDASEPCDGCCYGETMLEAAAEIARLQEAKRRALVVADERSKENVELRAEAARLRARPTEEEVAVAVRDAHASHFRRTDVMTDGCAFAIVRAVDALYPKVQP